MTTNELFYGDDAPELKDFGLRALLTDKEYEQVIVDLDEEEA